MVVGATSRRYRSGSARIPWVRRKSLPILVEFATQLRNAARADVILPCQRTRAFVLGHLFDDALVPFAPPGQPGAEVAPESDLLRDRAPRIVLESLLEAIEASLPVHGGVQRFIAGP